MTTLLKSRQANRFAWDLYRALSRKPGNLFFSPVSMRSALGRAAVGAGGNTREQMVRVLGLREDSNEGLMAQIIEQEQVRDVRDVTIAVANKIFAHQGYNFDPRYMELMRQYAGIQLVDFAGDFEGARQTINSWVARETNELIQELLAKGSLDSFVRMVLGNAIYFKGSWLYTFDSKANEEHSFLTEDGARTPVTLMVRKVETKYADFGHMQVVQLPFVGKRIVMTVFVPSGRQRVSDIESHLTTSHLQDIQDELRSQNVDLYMLKFNQTWGATELSDPLISMGMTDAFDDLLANFEAMDPDRNLKIGAVYHKANIICNEEGAEAAAATAVVMTYRSISVTPTVVLNRPFVYVINDLDTGTILFMGRMMNPAAV